MWSGSLAAGPQSERNHWRADGGCEAAEDRRRCVHVDRASVLGERDRTAGLQLYDVEADTGRLVTKPNAFFETQGHATSVEIDAHDRFLFSVSAEAGAMSAFRIDPATGGLEPGHPTTGLTSPYDGSDFRRAAIANVR
jgi:hypothetical protein